MAQLVFVHGVATRNSPENDVTVHNRNILFEQILFQGKSVDIYNPQWGNIVPDIDPVIFETGNAANSFSLNLFASGGIGGGFTGHRGVAAGFSIADIAKQNPEIALDAIFAEMVVWADENGQELDAQNIADFRKAVDLVASRKANEVVDQAGDDDTLVLNLRKGGIGSLSISSKIGDAVSAVTNRMRNGVSTLIFDPVLDRISPKVGLFLGDVFCFLKDGTLRQEIQAIIRDEIIRASNASKSGNGPLVLIGHSMGGVILTDMLLDPIAAGLPADLEIAALITVGSQPGLFQALGALPGSQGQNTKTNMPSYVKKWMNVFDPIDPLAFRADCMFEEVEDLEFNSITGLFSAHTSYFKRPQFYARCGARLNGVV